MSQLSTRPEVSLDVSGASAHHVTRRAWWLQFLAPILLMNLVVVGTALSSSDLRATWLQEDAFLESTTAITFGLALVVGAIACAVGAARRRLNVLVPLFALFCALEESSYGERLIGLQMPSIGGVKVDAVHDVFELAYTTLKQQGLTKLQMAAGIVAGGLVLCLVVRRYWQQLRPAVATLRESLPLQLIAMAVVFCLAAVCLDLKVNSTWTRTLEELLEFNAALLTLFAATNLLQRRAAPSTPSMTRA